MAVSGHTDLLFDNLKSQMSLPSRDILSANEYKALLLNLILTYVEGPLGDYSSCRRIRLETGLGTSQLTLWVVGFAKAGLQKDQNDKP